MTNFVILFPNFAWSLLLETKKKRIPTFLAQRASIFMLGIAVLMIGSIPLPHSKARQIICLATGITMLGLACMGSVEFFKGTVNSSILTAIIVETIIGISFGILFFTNKKTKVISDLNQ